MYFSLVGFRINILRPFESVRHTCFMLGVHLFCHHQRDRRSKQTKLSESPVKPSMTSIVVVPGCPTNPWRGVHECKPHR